MEVNMWPARLRTFLVSNLRNNIRGVTTDCLRSAEVYPALELSHMSSTPQLSICRNGARCVFAKKLCRNENLKSCWNEFWCGFVSPVIWSRWGFLKLFDGFLDWTDNCRVALDSPSPFPAESNKQFNGNVSCTEQTAQLTSSATHAFDMHPCLDELIGNKHYTTLNAMSADQMNEDGNVAYNQFHDSIFIVLNLICFCEVHRLWLRQTFKRTVEANSQNNSINICLPLPFELLSFCNLKLPDGFSLSVWHI